VCELSQLKDKGFGFIKPQDGCKNMFFHVSGDGNEHAQSLVKGQAVSYLPARNRRGPCAIFIKDETQETSQDDTLLETADARQIRARCDARRGDRRKPRSEAPVVAAAPQAAAPAAADAAAEAPKPKKKKPKKDEASVVAAAPEAAATMTTLPIDRKDLADAIRHGERIEDPPNRCVCFRHDGVLYVTEADGKTAIAAHAESDAAKAAETLAIAIMAAGPCSEASRDYEQWRRENKDTTKFSNWFEWENAALGDLRQAPKKISGEMFERIMRRRMSGPEQLAASFPFMRRHDQRKMRAVVEAGLRGDIRLATELGQKVSQLESMRSMHRWMPKDNSFFPVADLTSTLRTNLETYGLKEWPRLTTDEVRDAFRQAAIRAEKRRAEAALREAKAIKVLKEAQAAHAARQAGELPDGADWAKGCCATLKGLQARQDLNGSVVEILDWNRTKGRWGTKVAATGEEVAVKPSNLTIAPDDWPLCDLQVPEKSRRDALRRLVCKIAANPTTRSAQPRNATTGYSEQEPLEGWQPPAAIEEQRLLALELVAYGESGEWIQGRGWGLNFQGSCAPAGPPLLKDLIWLDQELSKSSSNNCDELNMVGELLKLRGVTSSQFNYAPHADPLLVRCARRGGHRDRQMIRALVQAGEDVERCLRWREKQEKMGGYTNEYTWNGDTALMAAAKKGNLAAVKTLLSLGASNGHHCCYMEDEYDNSAADAAKRKGHTAVAEFIARYKSGQEVPSLFELASLELGTEELAKLPESGPRDSEEFRIGASGGNLGRDLRRGRQPSP